MYLMKLERLPSVYYIQLHKTIMPFLTIFNGFMAQKTTSKNKQQIKKIIIQKRNARINQK